MMNSLTALMAILGYGLTLGSIGVLLAIRERSRRQKARSAAAGHEGSVLAQTLHGRLRTDSGEEMEVYLQSATR